VADPAVDPFIGSAPQHQRPTRVRYWVLVFTVTLAVITYIDRVAISFALPYIGKDLGLDSVHKGWVLTAFALAYSLFEIPGGFLGDWMGPRRVILRIVLWWSFFTAATGWAWNFASLVTARFLFGAGEAGCFPNLTKMFTIWLPGRERVRAQGLMWLSARWGGAFTPPLAAAVITWVGWRHAFELFGVLGVIWAIAFFLWYRDNPLDHPKLNEAERELLRGSDKAFGDSAAPWGELVRSRRVWLLCWQYFFLNYGWYFNITWLPTYLRDARGMDVAQAAMFGVLPLFMGGLGNPASVFLGERLLRRTRSVARTRRIVASLGYIGACTFLIITTYMQDARAAVISISLASFFNDLAMPPSWAASMDMGGRFAGTLAGAMNSWGNLGGAVAPAVIGYVLAWTNNNWNIAFYISAILYAAAIPCWIFLDSATPLEPSSRPTR
jgi:ACS family glucarate transporter-like MFS transporter